MANWIIILTVMTKFLSLPRALQIISPVVRSRNRTKSDEEKLATAVDVLLATDVWMFRPSCWKRAAILHRYLALRGIESRINFGARKESGGGISGHAWLEREGRPILEPSPPNYTVTFAFPGASEQSELSLPLET